MICDGFFDGKRVLVTGIAGVKGSWLALLLLDAGASVVGVDLVHPSPESNYMAAGLESRVTRVRGDITDLELMCLLTQDVDAVFHLAAVSLVGEARRNPLEAYRTNTLGTATVLEACCGSNRVRHVVIATTDKVYQSREEGPWRETDPLVATGPYAVSKACAEHVAADYYATRLREHGIRMGVARAGNAILGGDFNSSTRRLGSGRIFVDCYDALLAGQVPTLFQPRFSRPYTYGLDLLVGYMTLMRHLDDPRVDGEAFNFGPLEPDGIENRALATKICTLWGAPGEWVEGAPREEPFACQKLDWQKAEMLLGWKPAYSIDEGLSDTTRWYRAWGEQGRGQLPGALYPLNRELIQAHRASALRQGIPWASRR